MDNFEAFTILNNVHQTILSIGGSPSTGSSLLRQILNRNSQIFCAPELHLFCKPSLYEDWDKYKQRILRKSFFGLPSAGFHSFVGFDLSEVPQIDKISIKHWIKESLSFIEFSNRVLNEISKRDCRIIGDKTPANSCLFFKFLQQFPNGKVIHIVRNPYDVIASLVSRGKDVYFACCLYLYNTQKGLLTKDFKNYLLVRYEDLVEQSQKTTENICLFLDVEFEDIMLSPTTRNTITKQEETTQLEGWKYDESGQIERGSVGRFETLDKLFQEKIRYYLDSMRLATKDTSSKFFSFKEVCELLEYEVMLPHSSFKDQLDHDMKTHIKSLWSNPMLFNRRNYPFYV